MLTSVFKLLHSFWSCFFSFWGLENPWATGIVWLETPVSPSSEPWTFGMWTGIGNEICEITRKRLCVLKVHAMRDSKVTGITSGSCIKRNLISWIIKCICLLNFSTVTTGTCFRRAMSSSLFCLRILMFAFLLSVIIAMAWWRWITYIFRPTPGKTMRHLYVTNSSYFHFVLSKIRFYRWVFEWTFTLSRSFSFGQVWSIRKFLNTLSTFCKKNF